MTLDPARTLTLTLRVCRFRNAAAWNIAGVVQQMRNHDFDRPRNVVSDRRKPTAEGGEAGTATRGEAGTETRGGFYWTGLTDALRRSLVEFVRRRTARATVDGRAALEAHDAAKLARREERVITLLNATVDAYAYNNELFQRWTSQGVITTNEVKAHLKDRPEAQQLEWLRLQIEMRVLGLGWSKFATRWSSQADSRIGTLAHLKMLLVDEILPEEAAQRRLKRLPTEAAPPQNLKREHGTLGTIDADAAVIERRALFSMDELKLKADAATQRRVAAGITDDVENLQPQRPAFDQELVGKWLEVRWRYTDAETGEYVYIWTPGRVVRVADGLCDKRSKQGKKLLPAGAVLWGWEADDEFKEQAGEQWLTLLPAKYNQQVWYGWRYDPRELVPAPAEHPEAAPTPGAQRGGDHGC